MTPPYARGARIPDPLSAGGADVIGCEEAAETYRRFVEAKAVKIARLGFDVSPSKINPALKPHRREIVRWMVAGGRRACFMGLGTVPYCALKLKRRASGSN